jgi:transposase
LDHPEICTNICEVLGVSLASVKHWQRNIWDFGNVQGNPNQSRVSQNHLNEEKMDQIVHLYYMTPLLLLDKVKEWIQVTHNIPISCSAVCQYIKDAGFTYKRLKLHASECNEEAAEHWMMETNAEFVAE